MPAEPGFAACAPGSVVIMMLPVSVCHQVSTTGQRPPPITSRYQIQAFGLIGSPTLPSSRSDERSRSSMWCGSAACHFMHALIAVGAV